MPGTQHGVHLPGPPHDGANAANGNYDLKFTVYNALTNGDLVAGPFTNAATMVSNGLFTVTLDFGASVFFAGDSWLEIAAQTNHGVGFTVLSPRQALTPVPYAVYAAGANSASFAGLAPAPIPTINSTS